jgi:hypothetical protein
MFKTTYILFFFSKEFFDTEIFADDAIMKISEINETVERTWTKEKESLMPTQENELFHEEPLDFIVEYEMLLSRGICHLNHFPRLKDAHFDFMLSYRVNSEGPDGNGLVPSLYKSMRMAGSQLLQEDNHWLGEEIPRGTYPTYAKISEEDKMSPRIYLDKECLLLGYDWLEGFTSALCNTLIFIPVLSIYKDDKQEYKGSVGQLLSLDPVSGDKVDNFLLEVTIANALMDLPADRRWLQCIVPIFVGKKIGDNFGEFDWSLIDDLPTYPSPQTNRKAAEILRKRGYPVSRQMLNRSVKDNIDRILKMQGIKIKTKISDRCRVSLDLLMLQVVIFDFVAFPDSTSIEPYAVDVNSVLKQLRPEVFKMWKERDALSPKEAAQAMIQANIALQEENFQGLKRIETLSLELDGAIEKLKVFESKEFDQHALNVDNPAGESKSSCCVVS